MEQPKSAELFKQYVRGSIDFIIEETEDQFPVMGSVLVKTGVANYKQLELLEAEGVIKSITVEVPSVLKLGAVVKEKAYYTERRVPELVKAQMVDIKVNAPVENIEINTKLIL